MKKIKISIFALLAIIFLVSCADLETVNLNNADIDRALGDPNEWEGIIQGQFNPLWHSTQHFNSAPSFNMGTVADAITSSWGNFGMRDLSSEPRVAINNSETYNYIVVLEQPYYNLFSVIGSVNDILKKISEDPTAEPKDGDGNVITGKLQSVGHFLQGAAFGYLSMAYDKAQFADETSDPLTAADLPFDDYKTIADKAVGKLDQAISEAQSAPDFTMGYWNGVVMTKEEYIALIRTYQARILAYNPRTPAENSSVDWGRVMSYAREGIQSDFSVEGDGSSWWDAYKYYGSEPIWARVDYRVMQTLADGIPGRFPEDNSHPFPIHAPEDVKDQRIDTDFTYHEAIIFRANRGLYHYSHYQHSRYFDHYPGASGSMPHILKDENDLLLAEAIIRSGGDKSEAAALNNATRVERGGMDALDGSEGDDVLLEALLHERLVELMLTGGGLPFYDRRRIQDDDGSFAPYSGLQPGSYRQLPIPAKELNVLEEEIYTFGG